MNGRIFRGGKSRAVLGVCFPVEYNLLIFLEDQGRIVVANAAKIAFANIRQAFAGEAKRLGQNGEQDVVALVDGVRKEMWEERYANHDLRIN